MRIQHNIAAMNAYRNYNNNVSAVNKNLEKLSSGYRINRAGDDAAGLAISEKMRAQIKGLEAAQKNVKDGISFVKTAEGAMQEIQDMLGRMKYLATQSANGTYDDDVDRNNIQLEVDALLDEIDRIAEHANFNGIHMLNGPAAGGSGSGSGSGSGGAVAAVYELDLSSASFTAGQTLTYAGVTVTEGTTTGLSASNDAKTNASAIADALNADTTFKASYTAAADASGKITITAKNAGVDANKTQMTTATTGDVNVTPTEKTAGADAPGGGGNGGGGGGGGTGNFDLTLQIGDSAGETIQLQIQSMSTASIAVSGLKGAGVKTRDAANGAIDTIKEAINTVSTVRGQLGAYQNRLEHTQNNLSVMTENIQDAESSIRDTDIADEMMAYTKNNILVQSAQAMLAQANQIPQGVLQLLG